MSKPTKTYETMKAELDQLMAELQNENIGVDQALEYYERGLKLIKEIEDYLKKAENKITEIKAAAEKEP